jgi:hypothetical protein
MMDDVRPGLNRPSTLKRAGDIRSEFKIRCRTTFRVAPPADVEAVAKAVLAIGRLMQTTPGIVEVDVNPLMVHAKGHGATALDALIVAE